MRYPLYCLYVAQKQAPYKQILKFLSMLQYKSLTARWSSITANFQRYLFLPYYLKLCIFSLFLRDFWFTEVLHCRVLAFIFCSLGGFLVFVDFSVLSLVHFSYCWFDSFLLFLSHQRNYYKKERETERDRELIYLEYWWVNHKLWKSIRVALPSIATTSTRGVITSLTWVSFISNTFSIISCEDKAS